MNVISDGFFAGKIGELEDISRQLRLDVIEMLYRAQSGHPGGSLSAVEIIATLYFKVMRIDPGNPKKQDRDRFILSKGHGAPILYAALARRGYFNKEELSDLRQIGSILQGHPDMKKTPGVDFSSGSLGQGLSVGCGMALGSRLNKFRNRIYVLLGDGELNEGQVWEAAMSASKFRLNNLVAIVDHNRVQLDGTTDEIMPMEPMADKWKAFGWNTYEVDGHSIRDIINVLENTGIENDMPNVIIARTVKGKGVPFMENRHQWHGKPINREEYEMACNELEKGRWQH